jgi:hypothetical protein
LKKNSSKNITAQISDCHSLTGFWICRSLVEIPKFREMREHVIPKVVLYVKILFGVHGA